MPKVCNHGRTLTLAVLTFTLRGLYERFTEKARQVVAGAQNHARDLRHNYIGTEHILLGLITEREGVAARVLSDLGVEEYPVKQEVTRIIGQGDQVTTGQIPLTPRAKKCLELASREALSLGHNYIGTEHVLLGLLREDEGVATRILNEMGVEPDVVRTKIHQVLGTKVPFEKMNVVEPTYEMEAKKLAQRELDMWKRGFDAGWEARGKARG